METKLCFDGFLFVKWGQGKDNLNEEKVYTIWGKEEELSIWVSIKKTEKEEVWTLDRWKKAHVVIKTGSSGKKDTGHRKKGN